MKLMVLVFATLIAASLALAGEASIEKGKELFTGKELGTNDQSCASCHPDGKGLEEVADLSDEELGKIVNNCIEKPLKGKALDPASTEMKSIIAYIKGLSPGKGK